TTRATRACTRAIAHIAQGSRVTYSVDPGKRWFPSRCPASRNAPISACALGSFKVMLRFHPSPTMPPSSIKTAPTGTSPSASRACAASSSARCMKAASSGENGLDDGSGMAMLGWLQKEANGKFYRHRDSTAVDSGVQTFFVRAWPRARSTIHFHHGAAWKMAISRYMKVMPSSDSDPWPIVLQSISAGSLPVIAVAKAMAAKVGAAARCSQPPASLPSLVLFLGVFIVPVPPDAACFVAPARRTIEPLIRTPQDVESARIGRIGVIHGAVFQREGAHARQFAQVGAPV